MSTDGETWTAVADSGNVSYSIAASPSYFYYGGSKHLFRADASTGEVVNLLNAMTAAADDNVYINDIIVKSEDSVFLFTKLPFKDFFFTYYSENPLASNHMIGNGHTFSIGWVLNTNR